MLSKAKHPLAGHTLSTVIPREHSDRGNLLAGYTLCAGCRWSASRRFFTPFRMTCPHPTPTISYLSGGVTLISTETQFLVRVVQMCR